MFAVVEVLSPLVNALGLFASATVGLFVYGLAEHLIMSLEARNILWRLKQDSKQI